MFKALLEKLPPLLAEARAGLLYRVEQEIEAVDLFDWLIAQEGGGKGYWSSRDGSFAMAGLGRCLSISGDELTLLDQIPTLLQSAPTARFFGGISFFAHSRAPQGLDAITFILPRFELLKRGERFFAAINVMGGESLDKLHALRLPRPAEHSEQSLPPILQQQHTPARSEWLSLVETALSAFRESDFEKVVPARCTSLECAAAVEPIALLRRALCDQVSGFCFSPGNGESFIGATPENLFSLQGGEIKSEALAGTSSRSDDPDGAALRASAKDCYEHRLVVDAILAALKPLCETLECGEREVLRLPTIQHLLTPIAGCLKGEVALSHLIESLHPTPALGGTPRATALKFLSAHEEFERGWFAGPVGWIGSDSAEFAVAIRSALVVDKRVELYAGAGIVEGSQPAAEWRELDHKISQYLEAFESGVV